MISRSRSAASLVAVVLVAAVAAAACGSSTKATSPPTPVTSATGGSTSNGGTVTIALGGPFSGAAKSTGDQIRAGAKLAADQLNRAGGIANGPRKGAKVAFKEFDDADDPAKAADNIRAIVDDKSLLAFVGSGLSDASVAAAPVASQAGFSYLAAYASSPKILDAATANKSVFVVAPTFPAYSFSVVDELVKAGYKHPGIIHLSGTYGDGVASLAGQRLTAKSATVADNESFAFADTDFRTQLAKIKAASPDSLIMVGLPDSDALILKQADQLGLKVPTFDPGGITNDATFLVDAGPLANGLVGNSPSDAQRNTPAAVALRTAYTTATGEKVVPDPAAFSYESIQAIAAALADGATGRDDLAVRLHHISIPDTGVGSLSFAADGSRIGGRLYIFTITNGQPVFKTGYQQTGPMEIKEIPLDR